MQRSMSRAGGLSRNSDSMADRRGTGEATLPLGISDSRGKASPLLNVLDTDMNKKYVMYYLRSMAYGDVFTALATGIRVRSCDLRWNKLAELFYPVPPREEQDAIVSFIDAKLKRIAEAVDDKKRQLATLEEYKKSLIFEYVTGKKEVPT